MITHYFILSTADSTLVHLLSTADNTLLNYLLLIAHFVKDLVLETRNQLRISGAKLLQNPHNFLDLWRRLAVDMLNLTSNSIYNIEW